MVASETGPTIQFRALGTPELSSPEAELQSILVRPKLLGLLSYLAAASPRGFHRRDTLLGLFWAESDQSRARRALRQSLYYLRQSLGAGVLIGRGEDEVGIDVGRLRCDVWDFEAALEAGRRTDALDLYRGDLLEGFFVAGAPQYERWLDGRREALRRQASDAAWGLAEDAGVEGNAASAGHWARRAVALAPFDEHRVMRAIELLDRMGDRSGALRLYEAFGRRLEEELEIEPSPETQELVAAIRDRGEASGFSVVGDEAEATALDAGATSVVPRSDDRVEADREGVADDFAGDAVGALASAAAVVNEPAPSGTGPSHRSRAPGWRGLILGLAIGVTIVIALFRLLLPGGGSRSLNSELVVVSVFDNQTGDADLDPVGRMAADWITQALHEAGVVDVVPSTIGLAPRPDFTDVERPAATTLAEQTGAGTIVTGAYYRRGDSLHIQAQVIDARDGRLLSALPPVGSPLAAPGAAVDSLSRIVARTLAVVVEPSLAMSADVSSPPSLEAYREYLEGFRTFQQVPLRMREALVHFYRAVTLDSTFLAPRFYIVMAHNNLNEIALADSNARVLETRRVRLSDSQRNTLDWMLARLRGDQMGALEAARARGGPDVGVQALIVNRPAEAVDVLTSVDLSSHYFQWLALMEALHLLGDHRRELGEARRGRDAFPARLRMLDAELRALAALGRVAEAERIIEQSLSLPGEEPVTPATLMVNTAAELVAHGHRDAALEFADHAVSWLESRAGPEPASWSHRHALGLAYYQAGRWANARSLFDQLAIETPEHMGVRGVLGALAARRDDRTQAIAISGSLTGTDGPFEFGLDAYRQARIASVLGDPERAVALLREAFARGLSYTIEVHRDIDLQPLRGYPPFLDLIRPKG